MADDDPIRETLITPAPVAPIAGRFAPTPYSFEFTGEDNLRLTVHNSLAGVVVSVHYRVHRRDAPTHASVFTHVPTSDRLASVAEFSLGEGFLLNVTCFASNGSPKIGQTFMKLEVIRGRQGARIVLGSILQDYVTAQQPIAWPGSPIRSSLEGQGVNRMIYGTYPGAGNEVAEIVPTGARWELVTFRTELITSSFVATRRSGLYITDLSRTYWRSPAPLTQAGGTTVDVYWAQSGPFATAILTDVAVAVLPAGLRIPAAHRIGTATNAIQSGDAYQIPVYTVNEWLEAQ